MSEDHLIHGVVYTKVSGSQMDWYPYTLLHIISRVGL